ncbi:Hpt domain-containing protein [Vibrio variabilis]|uniref:Hpt domain-containing protein n=1 Tax=Vibrio variabilis TaxID=990271 RepID=UPI000DD55C7C|nr:Hpt domain-containing protein [Vibrio variabilis]
MNVLKRLNGFAVTIVLLWSIAVAIVVYISSQEEKITHLIDEISFSIDKLRQTLFLAQPYRSRFSEQLELEIQLIHAQTVQLKSLTQSDLLSDVSHTVYLLERFVEQAQLLAQDEARMDTFIASINAKPTRLSSEAVSLSDRLSAVVLDTLFNDTVEPRQVYLKLEDIQREAYGLSGGDRVHVLELNSQASVLLSQAANTEFLVERVVNHPVMTELSLREMQSERAVNRQVLIVVLASLVAIVCLLLCSVRKQPESLLTSGHDDLKAYEPDSVTREPQLNKANEPQKVKTENRTPLDDEPPSSLEVESLNEAERVELEVVGDEVVSESEEMDEEGAPIQFSEMLNTLDGDKESMLLLLGVFVSEHSQDADKLRNLAESDIDQATRVAHTLKGVSGSIFAEQLRQTAITAELQLKQTQAIDSEAIDKLEQRLKQAIVSAEDYISNQSQQ